MTTNLAIGSEFAGHRIEALAGRGGMGVIFRATHLRLGRTVALKLVAEELAQDMPAAASASSANRASRPRSTTRT